MSHHTRAVVKPHLEVAEELIYHADVVLFPLPSFADCIVSDNPCRVVWTTTTADRVHRVV